MSETRKHDVTVCSEECCYLKYDTIECMNSVLEVGWLHSGDYRANLRKYCPICWTRVGIDKRGPWREAAP